MRKIAIVGCGGFGREVKMLIDQINEDNKIYQIIGFFDDNVHQDELINGVPFLGEINEINEINFDCAIAVGIGTPQLRKSIIEKISNPNISYPNLIHPNALIGKDNVSIGTGNIICAGVLITIDIQIKDFVILNLNCTVGHDSILNSYTSFMPGVNISGDVIVEEGVYIGSGACVINRLNIGRNTTIGAGAVVTKSLPANCTAVGIPAKPIKFHE